MIYGYASLKGKGTPISLGFATLIQQPVISIAILSEQASKDEGALNLFPDDSVLAIKDP